MIKIEKDLGAVPASLNSDTTRRHREALIALGKYLDDGKYNDRYKLEDIKAALKVFYNGKCAYCESVLEQLAVEHLRPKHLYWWLAFSWDNLLLACPTCNSHKNKHFPVQTAHTAFQQDHLNDIHALRDRYDADEQPLLFNPEKEDPEPHLVFSRAGGVHSTDPRMAKTIEICQLDRPDLCENRKKVMDLFEKDVAAIMLDYQHDKWEAMKQLSGLIAQFYRHSHEAGLPYLAYRRSMIAQREVQKAMMA